MDSAYMLLEKRLPLRRLFTAPRPDPERIFFHGLWFKGHNNPRYAELLPRLGRLDPYLIVCSGTRPLRGIEYRLLRATRQLRHPLLFSGANRRYGLMLTADNDQIQYFRGKIVVDVDDPTYTPREVDLLTRPNVAAYVVTAERAAHRFRELGVRKPYHVIPQGVSLTAYSEERAAEVKAEHKGSADVVVGYMAAFLRSADDRDGANPLYNVDHLLDVWNDVHARLPNSRLWLIGEASSLVRRRCAGREDIRVFGRVDKGEVLAHVSNFDIALYPRRVDHAPQAAKVAEYMGMGVPTVSYDCKVTEVLRETGAGILVDSPKEFVAAVERLALDPAARRRIAEEARRAGEGLDWDRLARRYETDVLDAHLGA